MDPACSATDPNTAELQPCEDGVCADAYPEIAASTSPSNREQLTEQSPTSTPGPATYDTDLSRRTTSRTAKLARGWRRIVRNFTPSWFAVTMGTGIVSILLHNLPYNGRWLQYLSYVVFCLNVFLFVLFTLLSLLRYTLYPSIWMAMVRHPNQSLFVGCCPMGLATIINMIVFVCVPAWGGSTWKLAWALWWIDVVAAVASCCYLPFVM